MSDKKLWEEFVALEKERDALRAEIESMKRQEPAAWLDDGTCRSGSEATAHRIVTNETKRDMPASVANSFSVPLYAEAGAQPAHEVQDVAAQEWLPIETAPNECEGRGMFVVRAFDVQNGFTGGFPYTSDPWCVWRCLDGGFARWPHNFPPTHWMPLPSAPKAKS